MRSRKLRQAGVGGWGPGVDPGPALRAPAELLRAAAGRSRPLLALLLRYVEAYLFQVSQSAVCNSLHPVEKRCCRWLLLAHSRLGSDEFLLTQESLARMLGVRQ